MKKLFFLLIPLILFSCSPCKRLTKRCPPVIRDSISYIETIAEDSNYTIPDSAFWQLSFECDSNFNVILRQLNEANTGLKTETLIKTVYVYSEDEAKKKVLFVSIKAKADSILTLNKTIEKLKKEVRTVEVPRDVPVKYIPKFHKFCTWGFCLAIITIIIYIIVRIKSKWLKSFLNRLN